MITPCQEDLFVIIPLEFETTFIIHLKFLRVQYSFLSICFACHFSHPLTSEKLARAYSMVRSKKVNAKVMLRTMRDMLVLLVCCCETTGGPWNNERLTEEMNCVFKGPKEKADFDELMS